MSMFLYSSSYINFSQENIDASGRLRVSQITTLGDLKTINHEENLLLESIGNGTKTFSENTTLLEVTSGQYLIKRSRNYFPYFSGKSQIIECTFDNFNPQNGVIKRIGYFDSNTLPPYDSNKDGFWIESGNDTIKLVVSRNGIEVLNLDWTLWTGYDKIKNYNFQNFTVIYFDYLWLGGAILRLFIKTDMGFVLAHVFHYSGKSENTFTVSPNHNVRYEIRSSTGTGKLRYICSQVATEGSINESGKLYSLSTGHIGIVCNVIGTKYPLIGIRKNETNRDKPIKLVGFQSFVSSNTDIVLVTVEKNPTLSVNPLWQNGTESTEYALGNGSITVTISGTILLSFLVSQYSYANNNLFDNDYLSWLSSSIDNKSDEIFVCVTPITSTVTNYATINFKEY